MSITEVMDGLRLWMVFIGSAIIVLASTEIGFQLGLRQHDQANKERKIHTGPVVAASLGLLAFMLAFTFGAVTSRFDERKHLVLDEANAIGTAFMRADSLPQDEKNKMQRLLYDYITLRIEAVQSNDVEYIKQTLGSTERMQKDMWSLAMPIALGDPTPVSALLLQSLNQLVDLHQKRFTVALYHRMPTIFWIALYGLVILAMVVGGYDAGQSGGRRSITTLVVVSVAFSLMLVLIVALERPRQELTTVSQAALIDVQQSIKGSLPTP